MKVIANIPHDSCNITIYAWNQKYLIKYEQDDLEQTYKISEVEISNEKEVREIAENKLFIKRVLDRFSEMRADLMQAMGW
ncbi:MAG: hypothetical protein NZ551_03270 [Microscillaceae bacterium]|nr:hypothetical protein [Microscillaceae bacterium]MDW8460209.1 hypothetical protein [Cytophagales bacterium]